MLRNALRNSFQDLRYALRQLRRAPGFAFTVVLTLALSVGVATAVFCVIDTVILRPLPYANPDRIVAVVSTSRSGYTQPASWPSYQDERAQAHAFSALAGFFPYFKATMDAPSSGPVSLNRVRGTDNFFQVFGIQPILGRSFLPGEEKEGKNDVAVLSYEVWQKYFNGDRAVLNQAVKLDGHAYTVIGVMPAGFRFPLGTRNAIYTPIHLDQMWMNGRGNHWLQTIGRLKDGFTTSQAQTDLTQVFNNLARAYPTDGGRTVRLQPLAESVAGKTRGPLWTLFGAVLAVLAIGCVNIAGLLLARGVKREREMAMRVAIGGGRGRLLGQVLTEGLLLAILGAAGGVLLATAMLDLMRAFLIKALERGADIHMNLTVLATAVAIAVVASITASLYPALRLSGIDPNRALKAGGSAGTQRGQHRLRSGFVITQVALTLVLLVVSGLLIRVVTRYRHADLGFDPAHILSVQINLSRDRYQGRDMLSSFYRPLEERVSHLPGVQAAGFINLLPIEEYGSNSDIHIAGQPPYPPNQEMLAENRFVSAGYFDVMGIPLHAGRRLSASMDQPKNTASTVMVNDAFVHKFIPAGLDVTAQRIDDDDKQEKWTRIIGVSGNIRQDIYEPPLAERDWLMDEIPPAMSSDLFANMFLVVRTADDPKQVIPAVRSIMHELDPTVPFGESETMTEVVSETLAFERMESWLFGIFASLALTLALVGLYGLVSHEVEQSSRDIGVRMALGATRNRILSMVLQRVALMLAAGTAVGLMLTYAARKLIGMVIYFEAQREAGGFLLLALLLMAAGLLAALIPAARAASIEPMQALRSE
ncbi:MAG: ABC transporter permease [Terracidiphilus sp.]